jgi:hypothetical protein
MQIRAITTQTFPYDREHDLYQESYRVALRSYCEERGILYREQANSKFGSTIVKLRSLKHSYKLRLLVKNRIFAALVDSIAGLLSNGPAQSPTRQGFYEFLTDSGEKITACIDARDIGDFSTELAAEQDLYFKSNYWPTLTYPDNVFPVPNLNPLVIRDQPYFKELRATPKTLDLFAFFRVWGGSDELEGIEHNLSLIESLAKAPCSKFLCAYLVAGDISTIGKRLSDQNIQWTTVPMDKHELWQLAAKSRLNLVRLGMHECIPWRMIDVLAMGGCPVIDYGPQTIWPAPLVEGQHYLNLHTAPGSTNFDSVPADVTRWLATPGLVEDMSRATASYFDDHIAPGSLGREIVSVVEAHSAK